MTVLPPSHCVVCVVCDAGWMPRCSSWRIAIGCGNRKLIVANVKLKVHIHSLLVRRLCLRARSRMFCAAAGVPFIMSREELTTQLGCCDDERRKELCERLAAGTLLLPCLPRRKFKGIGRCMMILANGKVAAAAGPYQKKRVATHPANEGNTPRQASPRTRSEGGSTPPP